MAQAFTPARRAKAKADYVEALAKYLEHEAACKAVGIGRQTSLDWRHKDAEFRDACEKAQFRAMEVLVASAYERALNVDGKYDERTAALLTMFMVKAHRPQYRDSFKADIDVGEVKFTFQIPKPEGLGDGDGHPQLPSAAIEGEVLPE